MLIDALMGNEQQRCQDKDKVGQPNIQKRHTDGHQTEYRASEDSQHHAVSDRGVDSGPYNHCYVIGVPPNQC